MPPFFIFQTQLLQKQFASFAPRRCALADIAQLGERQTEDLKVPGSIPGVGIALVAQSVEHGSNKPRVGGSSPSWSSCILFFVPAGGFHCQTLWQKPISVL